MDKPGESKKKFMHLACYGIKCMLAIFKIKCKSIDQRLAYLRT